MNGIRSYAAAMVLGLIAAGPVHASGTKGLVFSLGAGSPYLQFDGRQPGLDLGNATLLQVSRGDFTVEAKVRFDHPAENQGPCFGPSCDMSIVDKMDDTSGANTDGWRLLKQSNDRLYFCLGGGVPENPGADGCNPPAETLLVSRTIVLPQRWYHLFVVKQKQSIALYVDGRVEARSTVRRYTDTNRARLLIGANAVELAYLNGAIRKANLYNRALSSKEIKARTGKG